MAKLLREYLGLEYDKSKIVEAIEKKQPVVVEALLQKADCENQNHRIYPKKILQREVENYLKAVRERRALGECVPAGTEILTLTGWKNIESVHAGEEIYTLNLEMNEIQLQKVEDKIDKFYDDKMVHIYNDKMNMMLTKNHKVLLWDRYHKPYSITAMELFEGINNKDSKIEHSYLRRSGDWVGEEPEYYQIPNSDIKVNIDDWAAFLGIYLAEGHCAGTRGGEIKNSVCVSQNAGDRQDAIRDLLNKLPFSFKLLSNERQFCSHSHELYKVLFSLGNSETKYIPEYAKQWSPRLLNIMFDWMLIGDGLNRKNRNNELMRELATISNRLANDVVEILIKMGTGGSCYIRMPKDREIDGRVILAENSKPLHIIHEHSTKGIYFSRGLIKSELVDFKDRVYCVSVANKTWLMRYNGKICWTHNCDHPESSVVELKNTSHLVTEIWWNGNDVRGKIEVLDTPNGKILQSLLGSGVKIGVSSRGVGETIKNESGCDIVSEDFMLICFDVVSEPSTPGAWLNESKVVDLNDIRKSMNKSDRIYRIVNEILRK